MLSAPAAFVAAFPTPQLRSARRALRPATVPHRKSQTSLAVTAMAQIARHEVGVRMSEASVYNGIVHLAGQVRSFSHPIKNAAWPRSCASMAGPRASTERNGRAYLRGAQWRSYTRCPIVGIKTGGRRRRSRHHWTDRPGPRPG